MKQRIAVLITIAMMAIQFTAAQAPEKKFTTTEKKITLATKNLLNALRSDNTGVLASALRITATMKMQHPEVNVDALVQNMNEIVKNNPSGSLRYKAYVAISVCNNPEWYINDENVTSANEEQFFYAASSRMREQLLTANTEQ